MVTRGSEWRRWDPHIHAPGTVLNNQFGGPEPWETYLQALETRTPAIEAIGVADYFVTDTYEEVLRLRRRGRLPAVQLIFPNVELRLDVMARSGGLVVVVGGKKARVVPVLARYHDVLGESAAFAGVGYVVGGADPRRHNVTTPLISSLTGGVDLARLDAGRLRASWLMSCAEAIGLSSFMAAAGLTCSQRLGDLAATVPPRDEAQTVALLGGCAE